MNSDEKETLAGLNVHIEYIRGTLTRLEKKIDELENQTTDLLKWKWKIIGISIGGATTISIIISAITLFMKFIK
ncbi:unnamed protein product [marine sediment metagenome]|uniref:Uncharacterized protein n=1 Tax=marine sediment metagenome TaxID=412755 RepID=X1BXR0_9ZZZZ